MKSADSSSKLAEKPDTIKEQLKSCRLCARNCGTDRTLRAGRCGEGIQIFAARAALHMWEEPCISGKEGSGAVFFSGCPLGCVFCQNREIAIGKAGLPISMERMIDIFLELQEEKANNINLVTPTQYVPQIIFCVNEARKKGLVIPIVYNTGSYETVETIRSLEGTVDIFLPDLKYFDPKLSERYSHAENYFKTASRAIEEMVRITGAPAFDERGMMQRGTVVRHLILPGHTKDSKEILNYLYKTYGNTIYVSIMNQYTPMPGIEKNYPELGRKVTKREYEKVVDYAIELGMENAFIQEGPTASQSFIPAFDYEGIRPAAFHDVP